MMGKLVKSDVIMLRKVFPDVWFALPEKYRVAAVEAHNYNDAAIDMLLHGGPSHGVE